METIQTLEYLKPKVIILGKSYSAEKLGLVGGSCLELAVCVFKCIFQTVCLLVFRRKWAGEEEREGVVWFWKQPERPGANFPQAGLSLALTAYTAQCKCTNTQIQKNNHKYRNHKYKMHKYTNT